MLTREATYEDYGFSEDEDKRLGEFCKNLEMRDKILLLQCAAEVYPNIIDELYCCIVIGMENFIREKSTQMWVETRKAGKLTRKAETDTIQKLVEYAKGQGSSHAEMLYMTYSRLANKMAGINKRDEATVMQLNNLSLMENIILHEVDLGIMRGKHYQEIYRDCKKRLEAVKDLAYLEAV